MAAALAATLVLAACDDRGGSGASDAPSPVPAAPRFVDALAAIDAELRGARDDAAREPRSPAAHERVARLLLERAALGGDFEDYAGALEAVARAGPGVACTVAARAALAAHLLPMARAHLERCGASGDRAVAELAALEGLRAELALQDGRLDEALPLARAAALRQETPESLARLARVHAAGGALAEATALLDRAGNADPARTPAWRAWLALQRGNLALHRGRWDDALAHYLEADRRLAGWWRVEEHVAEVRALLGQQRESLAAYRRALALAEDPPTMGAFALALREAGEPAEADAWIARAEALLRARLERLPEAALEAAVAYFLRFAPRSPETLALARRGAAQRRDGGTRLALARALLAAGHVAEAEREIRALLATPWRTAELHALAWHVFARAGSADAARAQALLADAANPRWRKQYPEPGGAP